MNFLIKHLNNQNESIQFTIEHERDNKIPFLDVMIEKDGQNVKTSIYRKNTHKDRYIKYSSHHHPRIFTGTIKCLQHRAERICDKEHLNKELKHLEEALEQNGFPKKVV